MVLMASSSTFPYGMMGNSDGGKSEGRECGIRVLRRLCRKSGFRAYLTYDMVWPATWWGAMSPQQRPIINTSTSPIASTTLLHLHPIHE
jgi:hypothetical protein